MDRTYTETVCAIALNSIFGFEPKIPMSMIHNLGSAEAVFNLTQDELNSILGPFSRYSGKICPEALDSAARELDALTKEGCTFVHSGMDCYPCLLKECEDAPVGLYVRSGTDPGALFGQTPCIAIVGTRDISPYGRYWCERAVQALSFSPVRPVIVSGLAIGVDITAHRAAMECGLPTIGVSPVGITDIYPWRHRSDAEKMVSTQGCGIVTDYPRGTAPVAVNFLRRNRIIAGMAQATLLIESKVKGGGMMTARLASGYGRDVFCLPGRVDDLRSGGCNRLIADKMADCLADPDSLPEVLGLGRWKRKSRNGLAEELERRYGGRDDYENLKRLAYAVRDERGVCLEDLCARLDMSYMEVSRLAGELESGGIITTDLMQRCSLDSKIS